MLTTIQLNPADCDFPSALARFLGNHAPKSIRVLGDVNLLKRRSLALFCSVKCPGDLILKTFDLARELRDEGVLVIGGFHSPMERECLELLLKGKQPVMICPARSIENMRLHEEWQRPLEQGRLLLLSPFGPEHKRVNARLAEQRNLFIAALATIIFIAHAQPGGKTLALATAAISWNKPVHTFNHPTNSVLIQAGAEISNPMHNKRFAEKRSGHAN